MVSNFVMALKLCGQVSPPTREPAVHSGVQSHHVPQPSIRFVATRVFVRGTPGWVGTLSLLQFNRDPERHAHSLVFTVTGTKQFSVPSAHEPERFVYLEIHYDTYCSFWIFRHFTPSFSKKCSKCCGVHYKRFWDWFACI